MANDAQLVQSTLSGSHDAFDCLMQRYQRLVYKVAYNFGHEKEMALDVVQSVFLKVYQKLASLKNQDQFKAWLMRITYNECVTWGRATLPFQPLEDREDEFPADTRDQEDDMLKLETNSVLAGMLSQLHAKHRLAVVLKYFEGLQIKEIAEVLQCSESVVKNMIYRGVKKMSRMAQATS